MMLSDMVLRSWVTLNLVLQNKLWPLFFYHSFMDDLDQSSHNWKKKKADLISLVCPQKGSISSSSSTTVDLWECDQRLDDAVSGHDGSDESEFWMDYFEVLMDDTLNQSIPMFSNLYSQPSQKEIKKKKKLGVWGLHPTWQETRNRTVWMFWVSTLRPAPFFSLSEDSLGSLTFLRLLSGYLQAWLIQVRRIH